MKFYQFSVNFDTVLYTVLLIIAIIFFKRIDRLHRSFFAFFILAGIFQDISYVIGSMGYRNHFIMPFLIAVQIGGLSYFYFRVLQRTNFHKFSKFIFIGLAGLFLIELVANIRNENFSLMWYTYFLSNIVFALVSFKVMIYQLSHVDEEIDLNLHIATFIYSSIAALVFLFGNILANIKMEAQVAIWGLHTIVHLIFISLIGYSLWKRIRY